MRSRLPRQLVLVLGLVFAGSTLGAQVMRGSQNPQPNPLQDIPTTTVHLQGIVLSSMDGKPVSRVLVSSLDGRFAALTDWQGHFSFDYRLLDSATANQRFPGLAQMAQTLRFSVRKPGYVSNTLSTDIPATPESQLIQLKITPCGVITGHVSVDSGELPQAMFLQVRHRMVQDGLARWVTSNATQTSRNGDFRVSDLVPGDYQVVTNAWTPPTTGRTPQQQRPDTVRGLLPASSSEGDTNAEPASIHIGAGETATANLTVHSATLYRVSVSVGGLPPDRNFGAELLNNMGFNLSINSASHMLEGYLPNGTYAVRITAFGPARTKPGPGENPGAPVVTGIAHFQVASAPLVGQTITPTPGADIQVNVTRDFTNQQDNERLMIARAQAPAGPSVYINLQPVDNNNGIPVGNPFNGRQQQGDNFVLRNVPEGVYRVNINAPLGYVASAISGSIDLLREPLTVAAGGSAPSIDITLRDDSAMLTARIISGQPEQQGETNPVFVLCIPLDRPQTQAIMGGWSPQWGFRSPPLPPGRYLLLASHDQIFQTVEYRNPDVLRDLMNKGVVITLSSGQKAEADIPLMPEGVS